MGTHREQPPLVIRPRPSRRLAILVLLTHIAALAAVLALAWPWPLVGLAVLASLCYQLLAQVLRRVPWSIDTLVWQPDGAWRIIQVDGRVWQARLSPSTFVSLPLVVLNLHLGWRRRWSLPLFSDSLDAEQLRRLRQRLRIEGASRDDPAAVP